LIAKAQLVKPEEIELQELQRKVVEGVAITVPIVGLSENSSSAAAALGRLAPPGAL
jgi:hypothetical protein